jgi:hypothetical protein
MLVKILAVARFQDISQARNRVCDLRRVETRVLRSRRTECRTFTGAEEYRLAMGVKAWVPLC